MSLFRRSAIVVVAVWMAFWVWWVSSFLATCPPDDRVSGGLLLAVVVSAAFLAWRKEVAGAAVLLVLGTYSLVQSLQGSYWIVVWLVDKSTSGRPWWVRAPQILAAALPWLTMSAPALLAGGLLMTDWWATRCTHRAGKRAVT